MDIAGVDYLVVESLPHASLWHLTPVSSQESIRRETGCYSIGSGCESNRLQISGNNCFLRLTTFSSL
ncbi:hypothetical protein EC9_22480 [Rosistilla ulvae]|uniref:Uncharacterized protein n=1 Tax=Rosistilla ulvae TaxID=1930277 RepID=A0A517LZL9_9BACT|nr:hypothetical protein EC9_22480 [Rosistilla ulvae]